MNVFKLIQKFSARETVPVEVQDVVDFLRELGIKDEIYFWEVDVSGNRLKAAITHWEYPDGRGEIKTVADIHTERSLSAEEKRAAQVKELLHILDHEHFRVNTFKDVEMLIEKIVLPPDLIDYENDGHHALSDRLAAYHMLAVLVPWAARKLLIAPLKSGRVTIEKIADMVALPVPLVQFVMSDQWDRVFEVMMGAERPRIPDKVHTLKPDHSTIEVHSVPLGDDPDTYARRFHEKHGVNGPIAAYRIERRDGESLTLSTKEIASFTPPAD